jgi:cation diffusion facilitator CzcD-associated flavoprotein CzcO
MEPTPLPVAVLGAGPVGLAAAANLAERNIPFVLFEVGDDVAASVREWAHVQLFSPWRFDLDPASRRLLEATGWQAPDLDEHPTGGDLVDRYLAPLALLPAIAARLRTNRLVTSVTRAGVDEVHTSGRDLAPFVVTTDGPHGVERTLASAVIDATGTWRSPNPIGAEGVPVAGERRARRCTTPPSPAASSTPPAASTGPSTPTARPSPTPPTTSPTSPRTSGTSSSSPSTA